MLSAKFCRKKTTERDEEKLINSLTFNIVLVENRHISNGIGFWLLERISFVVTLQGIDKSKNHSKKCHKTTLLALGADLSPYCSFVLFLPIPRLYFLWPWTMRGDINNFKLTMDV